MCHCWKYEKKGRARLKLTFGSERLFARVSAAIAADFICLLSSIHILPAFFLLSCSSAAPTDNLPQQTILVKSGADTYGRTIDFLFFDDDPLGRLDSFSRIVCTDEGSSGAVCGSGRKIIAAISSDGTGTYDYADIRDYRTLSAMERDFCDEDPSCPLVSGEAKTGDAVITIKPLLTKIRINSLLADFRLHPYSGAVMENVKIYLTNIPSSSPVLGKREAPPSSWLNLGGYFEDDALTLKHPEMIFAATGNVGREVVFPSIELFCYPSGIVEESFGSPMTKLVIEAMIDGERWYYPILMKDLERGDLVSMDITFTGKGTQDPETPVSRENIIISTSIIPWTEKENITVLF